MLLTYFASLGILSLLKESVVCDYILVKESPQDAVLGIYAHTLSDCAVIRIEDDFYVASNKALQVADQSPVRSAGNGFLVRGAYSNGIVLTATSLWNSRLHRKDTGGLGPPWPIVDDYVIYSNGFANQASGDVRIINDFEARSCSADYLDHSSRIVLYGKRAGKSCFVFFPDSEGASREPKVVEVQDGQAGAIDDIGATPFGILASQRQGSECSLVLYDRSGKKLKLLAVERLRDGETTVAISQGLVTFKRGGQFAWVVGRRLYLGVLRRRD